MNKRERGGNDGSPQERVDTSSFGNLKSFKNVYFSESVSGNISQSNEEIRNFRGENRDDQ
ncbi:hypothetical protein [Cuniculiplasma divulgatum]|jgi:hypothetical protein|uniref:Uncharacterized protein n=1 Tax=Cuniculiplasma divulgatum TaxID=1673428 RepID=A0A1R4A7T6_9ARCH|nr:hypothetical protein [Cuniculiplasma divulgatum]EQB67868.1 MAG: hypothetical protein AMDU5_GPLC00022G0002 [Thermoplasmatales archaeon Gpl]SJK85022.1 hypothetical protein CPM_1214 [Cuniculiplasma divulgatum]